MISGILQQYIIKELLKALFLTFVILTLIFFIIISIQFVNKYSDYLSLLDFIFITPYLVIKGLSYTIPLSMLAATTLVYGRLAQDKEILILRTAGIHAGKIFNPAYIIGICVSCLCFYINANLVPYAFREWKEIKYQAIEVLLRANFSSKETTIDFIPNIRIYYRSLKNGEFQKLVIQNYKEIKSNKELSIKVQNEVLASSGKLVYDKNKKILNFYLKNGSITHISRNMKQSNEKKLFFDKLVLPIPAEIKKDTYNTNNAKYKLFGQLIEDTIYLGLKVKLYEKEAKKKGYLKKGVTLAKAIKKLGYKEMHDYKKYISHALRFHTKISISLAPLLIVFLGASLGLIIKHSNRLVAFGASSIPIILIYYPLQMVGEVLTHKFIISPLLGAWLGTIATGLIGFGLLIYVYRQ